MFSSSRNRRSDVSDRIRVDALGAVDRLVERLDGLVPFGHDLAHLAWMVVVIREEGW